MYMFDICELCCRQSAMFASLLCGYFLIYVKWADYQLKLWMLYTVKRLIYKNLNFWKFALHLQHVEVLDFFLLVEMAAICWFHL